MMAKNSGIGIPRNRILKACGLSRRAVVASEDLERCVWWWRDLPKIYQQRAMLARCWQWGGGDLKEATRILAGYKSSPISEGRPWDFRIPLLVAFEFSHAAGSCLSEWIDYWRAVEVRARLDKSSDWEPAGAHSPPMHRRGVPKGTPAEVRESGGVYLFDVDITLNEQDLVRDFREWLREEQRRHRIHFDIEQPKMITGPGGTSIQAPGNQVVKMDRRKLEARVRGWLDGTGAAESGPFHAIELFDRKHILGERISNDRMAGWRSSVRKIQDGIY